MSGTGFFESLGGKKSEEVVRSGDAPASEEPVASETDGRGVSQKISDEPAGVSTPAARGVAWDGVCRRESDKALMDLSQVLGNPVLEGPCLSAALIRVAVDRLKFFELGAGDPLTTVPIPVITEEMRATQDAQARAAGILVDPKDLELGFTFMPPVQCDECRKLLEYVYTDTGVILKHGGKDCSRAGRMYRTHSGMMLQRIPDEKAAG